MYVSSGYIRTKWGGFRKNTISTLAPFTYLEAAQLKELLEEDGRRVAYSAIVSIADAIRGIESGFYSWAIVKLYYSLFYTLRSFLCFDGQAIFFSESKPFKTNAVAGALPVSINTSSSHKAVMEIFSESYSGSYLLSQDINLSDPFDWMQNQRENVNYRQAKFSEPDTSSVFRGLLQARSIRKALTIYIEEDSLSFDEDHAILAYPILALKELKKLNPDVFDEDDQERLLAMLVDANGRISAFDKIVR